MENLPVMGPLGIPVGRLTLTDEWQELLRQEPLQLSITYNVTTGKVMGYTLNGIPKEPRSVAFNVDSENNRIKESKKCKYCLKTESKAWWKCCPKHTTENGEDLLCDDCAHLMHPDTIM